MRSGNCYEKSFQFLLAHKEEGWTLVHGIATHRPTGKQMGHAWVEREDVCYDAEKDIEILKPVFYALGDIVYAVRYSEEQAFKLALKHKHYGCWDPLIETAAHYERRKRGKSRSCKKGKEKTRPKEAAVHSHCGLQEVSHHAE